VTRPGAGPGHDRVVRFDRHLLLRVLVGDGLLALALIAVGIIGSPEAAQWQPTARHLDSLGYLMIVGAAAPVLVRRIWTLPALLATTITTMTYLIIGYPYGPIFGSLVVAIYTGAMRLPARPLAIGCAVAVAGLLVHVLVVAAGPQGASALVGLIPGSAWIVVPFAVGRLVRTGRDSAARSRAETARRYAYEERLRIAQEVHDVVGHGLAAINMQAEIALHVLPKRPEHAQTALAAISRTSKEALDELRATLATMRSGAPRTPGPGLAQLGELVARMSGTGVQVTVAVSGPQRSMPAAVDLASYRIVQEALTNVLRHAGPAAATVRVTYQPYALDIEVTDTGVGPAATTGDGHGIAGMRERVAALGGAFEAGPRGGGGFRVYARLPAPQDTP
jgi:signal transduction histidine kinase